MQSYKNRILLVYVSLFYSVILFIFLAQVCVAVLCGVYSQVRNISDLPLPWALANTSEKVVVRLW
jgi:hypothetical protein